jgi:hypothetical protein
MILFLFELFKLLDFDFIVIASGVLTQRDLRTRRGVSRGARLLAQLGVTGFVFAAVQDVVEVAGSLVLFSLYHMMTIEYAGICALPLAAVLAVIIYDFPHFRA